MFMGLFFCLIYLKPGRDIQVIACV